MTDDADTLRDHLDSIETAILMNGAASTSTAARLADAIIAACRAALGPGAKADGAAEVKSPKCRHGNSPGGCLSTECYDFAPPAKPEATGAPEPPERIALHEGHNGYWYRFGELGLLSTGHVADYMPVALAEREAAELRRHGDKMKEQRDALLALVQCTRDLGVVVDHTGELLGYDDARKRAETFASERDELRRQVSKLAEWCDALPKLIAERDEARARVAELEGALRDIGNSWCAECDGYDHTHLPTCSCAKPAPAAPPITSAAVESATQAMRGSGVGGGRPAK